MSNLTVISAADELALASMFGQEKANRALLPTLKVNLDDEDDQGNALPKGSFMITGQEVTSYAKKVKIKPLVEMFQYLDYDPDQNKTVNRTLIVPSFKHEFRDERGGVRCGKPASKVLKENPDLAAKYKSITCFRLVYALVSYEGKSATGETVSVENVPALLRLKGSNFSPFEDEVSKKIPKGQHLYNFWVEVSAERKKNGSVVYYVWNFSPDLGNPVPLDQQTYETMVGIASMIKDENTRIDDKHHAALRGRQVDTSALKAVEILEGEDADLEADLED